MEQHIRKFQISVDNSQTMEEFQSSKDLTHNVSSRWSIKTSVSP